MDVVLGLLVKYHQGFLSGLAVTIRLTLIIWLSGLLGGGALGILSARYQVAAGIPMRILSFLISGIPILVFLFWAHFPLQVALGVIFDPFVTAAGVLSLINILMVGELVRAHIVDFPAQYEVAARVCGLTKRVFIFEIQLPILLRQLIPALLPLQIVMLHSTLFASLISVEEIFRVSQRINSLEYQPVQIYTALALFFLSVSLPVNGLAIWLRSRFTRNISEN
jgi:ABC-type amino acid transport system permease subunit